jgi:FlgN protein
MKAGPVLPSAAMTRLTPAQYPPLVAGLTDAVASERRLVEELIVVMRRQREAVAADDLQLVDDSVFAVQRILITLGEARKRRRALNLRFGQPEDAPLRSLLETLGPYATGELHASRDALQEAARTLSREVATNRQILREALAAGEEVVRTLAGVALPRVGYGEATPAAPGASFLVNRQA